MDIKRKISGQNKLKKIFGIGPTGAIISLFLLTIVVWADSMIKLSIVVDYADLIKTIGIVLVILGLGLNFWGSIFCLFLRCVTGGQMTNFVQVDLLSIFVTQCTQLGLHLYLLG